MVPAFPAKLTESVLSEDENVSCRRFVKASRRCRKFSDKRLSLSEFLTARPWAERGS